MHMQLHSGAGAVSISPLGDADLACAAIVALVASRRKVKSSAIYARSRCRAPVASARQLAMYLCHVLLGLTLTEVGRYFGRDRTTVAHACALVEDMRDSDACEREILAIEHAILDRLYRRPSEPVYLSGEEARA